VVSVEETTPMSTSTKHPARLVIALGLLIALVSPAAAELPLDMANPAFVQVSSGTTSVPFGHAEFCRTRQDECRPNDRLVAAEQLNEAKWLQLLAINAHVNETVVPITDTDYYGREEFWTYPNGFGDCEDFVLEKRRALIESGWAPSTLLMAVVRQSNGEGHAVLLVRTERGDLVLDNQDGLIRLWNESPYKFLKRQSQADPSLWVDMFDDRPIIVAAR
jgi:predicted transglutaminase-like cysteine proteinase